MVLLLKLHLLLHCETNHRGIHMNKIYYVGYDAAHPNDFVYNVPEGFPNYLLVVTTTPALFQVNGNISEYPPHTAVLYPPGCPIWYGAARKKYGNHWLRFASDESFVTNFSQPAVPFTVSDPEYCHNLFQLLTWEASPVVISQLLRILFDKLRDDLLHAQSSSHDYELLSLRRRISASPQLSWSISDMAKELHISAGYLQLLYKQKFQISCMDDVIGFRLIKARDLLICTTQSISEIAEQCGYNNTEHFCRQFRKNLGLSPGNFRKAQSKIRQKETIL